MKKISTTVAVVITLLALNIHPVLAQLSIQPEVGYQLPLAGEEIGLKTNNTGGLYGTYGQGLKIGVDFQYKFSQYVDLDLGVGYWCGSTINYINAYTSADSFLLADSRQDILRMVVVSLGDYYDLSSADHRLIPFIGLGIDCAVGGTLKSNDTYTGPEAYYPSYVITTTSTTTTNVALGAYGKFGVKYHIGSHFSVLAELRFDALSLTPHIMTINSYSVNGGPNIVNTLPLIQRQTDYEKFFSNNYTISQTSPNEETAYKMPASAWGLNIGIVYNFGTSTKTAGTK